MMSLAASLWSLHGERGLPTDEREYKTACYIVSIKVQFFCSSIGQNRITFWSTERHVHSTGPQWNNYWPVNNIMGAVRARLEPWSSKVHFIKLFYWTFTAFHFISSSGFKFHFNNRWFFHSLTLDRRCCHRRLLLRPRLTVPDEFGTGLKFVRFGRVNTREPRNRTNLRPPNTTNSRVDRRKRTNFRLDPNPSPRVNGVGR
jgi:hypothetical protein